MMERHIVGLMVEADHKGEVKPTLAFFQIAKETDKMVYPDNSKISYDTRKTLGYLSHINKKQHIGHIEVTSYSTSFTMRMIDIVETHEQLEAVINRVRERVRIEIEDRAEVSTKWFEAFRKMVL
jgi:hypothetical protein